MLILQEQNKKSRNKRNESSKLSLDGLMNETIYNLIPLNIFQTWYTLDLPLKMKENVELLKKTNPEFNHYLYDDTMCREFIRENYNHEILYTFDKLKPGAYKADFWRYCILYKKGGIYLDIKYKCANGFKFITLTDKEYWVKDRPQIINGIYQALMISFPFNKRIYKAIQDVVKNVKYNLYSELTPLCVTGPGLLGPYFNPIEFNRLDNAFIIF